MKEPKTVDDIKAAHKILNDNPRVYLSIVDGWLRDNPDSHQAYLNRHFAWMRLGKPRQALEDLDKLVALNPDPLAYLSRGAVYRHLGEYDNALADFGRGERMIPDDWDELGFGLLQQADCYARLGDEENALACCERLPEDFWTPGMDGAPTGDKRAIAPKLRLLAAEARTAKGE
jgi:tetratricopeptide (TPR) repeat protein